MRVLLINGPNLNTLGRREPEVYGSMTLGEIEAKVRERAEKLGVEVAAFQSNHEGAIIDFIQQQAPGAGGIIINGGAFTHYSLAIRDALAGANVAAVEVHISNIHGREPFRRRSVTAGVCRGIIAGLGWYGYIAALEWLVRESEREKQEAGRGT